MANQTLSRRSFSKTLAAGAAYTTLRSRHEVRASLRPTPIVRLSSNENPYGPSPAALKAMTDGFSLAWRYPDEYADTLAQELALLHGVSVDQVLLGDGSGEILKLARPLLPAGIERSSLPIQHSKRRRGTRASPVLR